MTHRHWIIFTVGTLLVFTVSGITEAGVSERDWETGATLNGLLTYDDVNQREWLDLSETLLERFSGGILVRFETVIAETAPGGIFTGFSPAIEADVMALAESAGIDTSTSSFAVNSVAANELIDLLSPTSQTSPTRRSSIGYLTNFPDSPQGAWIAASTAFAAAGFYSGNSSQDLAGIPSTTGVWLYRDVIPEPASMTLLAAVGFVLIVCQRRTRDARDVL